MTTRAVSCLVIGVAVLACSADDRSVVNEASTAEPQKEIATRAVQTGASAAVGKTSQPQKLGQTRPALPAEQEEQIVIHAVGDCALGDLRHGAGAPGSFSSELSKHAAPMRYPFGDVASLFSKDDLTIANLEGPLTDSVRHKTEGFAIRGKPVYAQMLTHGGVDLVSIANNHSADYGARGLRDTKRALADAKVDHVGLGRVDERTVRGVKIINLAYIGGRDGTMRRMLRDLGRHVPKAAIVIVSMHWGLESFTVPDDRQRKLGRAAIRAGASLVIGHHPHVLQGVETYRGRHIVYSLGNFVFGANSQPEDKDSMIFREEFTLRAGKITDVKATFIPVSITSSRDRNDFRPKRLDGAERQRVLDKIKRLSEAI